MGRDFVDGIKPFLYNGLAILRYIQFTGGPSPATRRRSQKALSGHDARIHDLYRHRKAP